MSQQPVEPVEMESDKDLLRRITGGDDDAIGVLYDRYGGQAFGLAFRIVQDRGQAEDIVQEAFLSVWRRSGTFDATRGNVRGWLMSIVHNAAIDRKRGRFRHQQREVDIDDVAYRLPGMDVWDEVSQTLDRDMVRKALSDLPVEQREALEMAYYRGLTQQEISDSTGVPLGTIKSRARLGLRRLERELRQTFGADGE